MKLFLKRSLALFVSIVLLFGVLPEMGVTRPIVGEAQAAGSTFEEKDFRLAYAKTLLSQVGKRYGSGGGASGYTVNGTLLWQASDRVTTGTPLSPASLDGNTSYDCFGLVVTTLMAMGYDYFEDTNGVRYPLNGHYGGGIFNQQSCSGDMRSILYDHGTGDRILLHHSNDSKYNIWFLIGEIVDKGTNDNNVEAGDLLFTLTEEDPLNTNKAPGPFSAGQIYNVNHGAVALFTLKRAVNDTMPQRADYAQANVTAAAIGYSSSYPNGWEEALAVLENSWTRANNQVKSLFGVDLSGGSVRNSSSYYIPYIWDARGRGFKAANSSDYKRGFLDSHSNAHFATPYSSVWQIESLGDPGVSVNNNPFGKTSFRMTVKMEPIDSAFAVTINKTDKDTAEKLSGATFALQLWSEAAGTYVTSTEFELKEQTTGVYKTYRKSTGNTDFIPWTDDNLGKVKVVETGAPPGHSNLDSSNQPLQWTHEFPNNGINTQGWTIDAENPGLPVGFSVYKHKDGSASTPLSGAVFTLYSNEACTTVAQDINGRSNFTTGTNGYSTQKITFRLKSVAQTYYLKETTAPSGYDLNNSVFRITVSPGATGTIVIAEKASGASAFTTVKNITATNALAMSDNFNVGDKPKTGGLTFTKKLSEPTDTARVFWFHITGPDGYSVWESISIPVGGTSGSVTKNGLTPGVYTIAEVNGNNSTTSPTTSALFPYTVPVNVTANVVANVVATVSMTNVEQPGQLTITKSIDKQPGTAQTFWFHVVSVANSYDQYFSITLGATETSRVLTVTGLKKGDYTVTEVVGNGNPTAFVRQNGYWLVTPNGVTKNVPAMGTGSVAFTNEEYGSLTVRKNLDSPRNKDYTFWVKIEGPSGFTTTWKSFTIPAGSVTAQETIANIPTGNYTLTEVTGSGSHTTVSPSDAFPFETAPVNVTVTRGNTAIGTITNTAQLGSLQIHKEIASAMSEAHTFWFHVTGPEGYSTWISVTVAAGATDGYSAVLNNLLRGQYTVTEVTTSGSATAVVTTPAFPFAPVPATTTVSVVKGSTTPVAVTNNVARGRLEITKKTTKPVEYDTTFWLLVEGPSESESKKIWVDVTVLAGTDTATKAIDGLLIGSYTIKEVTGDGETTEVSLSASFPYLASGDGTVTITDGATSKAEWTNEYCLGSLTVVKNTTKPVEADTTFWLLVEGASGKIWVDVTIPAGSTTASKTIDKLMYGSYTIKEVTGNGKETEVSLSDAFPYSATGDGNVTVPKGGSVTATWTNEYRLGNLRIEKIDADGPLSGIEFTIYDDAACATELGKLITDASGKAESELFLIPLTGRKVYVKETKTDAYHILNTTVFEVELVPDSTVVVSGAPITNEIITGKIGLTKTGETFVGYTETSTEYGLLKTPKYATAGLSGAKFMIFKASDVTVSGTSVTYNPADAIETLTSTGSEVLSGELPLGKYVVVEHEAPLGYVKVPYVGTVELKKKDETTVLVVEHLTHKNQQAETSIGVYKEAEVMVTTTDGERITTTVQLQPGAGFVFGVYAAQDFVGSEATIKEGDLVLVGTTNADGRIDFTTKVPHGKYVIKELKTKDGYEISTDTYPVEIKATTGTETLIKVTALPSDGAIINGLRKKKLTVTKKSLTTDDPLPGTRIQIFDEEGRVIFDQITGEDGTIPAFYALYGRTYYFKEQYAPSGYAILTETFSFSIDAEGNVLGATELKDDVTKIRLLKTTEGGQPLKGVEFTLYDLEELPVQVVTSDENGIVEFKEIAYGDYIIKETRPAEGMQLADFRLDVHIDGTWVNDEPIKVVNLPDEQTGEPINIVFFGFLMAVICACFVIAFCYDSRIKAKAEANFIESVNNCYARK